MNRRVVFASFFWVVLFCTTDLCLAGEHRVLLRGPSPGAKNWLAGDVLVTEPTDIAVKPSMTSAPNGDLFVAVEEQKWGIISLYRSTDGGHTWDWLNGIASQDIARNPSIAYGEHTNGEKWLYVAYEAVVAADDTRRVEVVRIDTNGFNSLWSSIDGPFIMSGVNDQVHPQIITDFVDWGDQYWVYLTYAAYEVSYYPVYFSRSTDRGGVWTTPSNVTGGSENTAWTTRPEIAYGSSGLFIAFVKPGSNGASTSNQIWVTKSTDFGTSFTTPGQLTTREVDVFHPSIAAAHGVNSVVVAFTVDFGTDMDVASMGSIDGGTTWDSLLTPLPLTTDHESSVDLTVSNSNGRFHAAYKHEAIGGGSDRIWYTSASTANPTAWSTAVQVNEGDTVSSIHGYPRPTITVNPTMPSEAEAAIAWTDFRGSSYDAYFDSAGLTIFSDGFESGNTSAWSSSVP